MPVNKNWKINLEERTAVSDEGIVLKYEKKDENDHSVWTVIEGKPTNIDIVDATKIFEHEYAKSFITHFVEKFKLSIEEIAKISSIYCLKNGHAVSFSEKYLSSCMSDEEYLTINDISIIRSAVYFFRKQQGAKSEK
jgi:hypothetical protein